jgi:MerR family mercuric resistance operon transcriptional regulator
MPAPYAISEAARRAGITVHQLRTYLSARLVIPCATTAGGYLLFDETCVSRLRLIGAATRAGLRIREIADLVRALGVNDRQALHAARSSVAVAIGSRQAAIMQLQELVAGECGTAVMERAP